MENETTKEHFDKFEAMSDHVDFNPNIWPKGESLKKLFLEDKHLNNIPLGSFDRFFNPPIKGTQGPKSLSDNTCVLKHILIYKVLGCEPIFI